MYSYEIDHRNYRYDNSSSSNYVIDKENLYDEGNSNSGNYGHAGRIGKVGGSALNGGPAEDRAKYWAIKLSRKVTSKEMKKTFESAKRTVPPRESWRVSSDYTEADYDGMRCYASDGGSTYALHGKDIVSVCHRTGDYKTGATLIKEAVIRGGDRLDAFAGIGGFYLKQGFEPVSYCKFDENYAPEGWDKDIDDKEPVIFYKYTGNKFYGSRKEANIYINDWLKNSEPASDYDTAKDIRDRSIE